MKNIEIECPIVDRSTTSETATRIARKILADVMVYRRVQNTVDQCREPGCPICSSLHLPKIISSVRKNEPVKFVLPAFPGKSPNLEKVLGPLPDYAEQFSLLFLQSLCESIKTYYSPGIEIILCSDGRVFSDIVGMKEVHVTEYQNELSQIIEQFSLAGLKTFNLDDFFGELSFTQMRDELMKHYANSLDFLKQKIRNGATSSSTADERDANRMFCGITRFLLEDSTYAGQTRSRTALQKESRMKAYEVIRRSNAWSELIADRFPDAVRLSIHPQACGSKKIGIRLVGNETWMTPWHGVAVQTPSRCLLLKRSQAELLDAELVFSSSGRPSHYRLLTEPTLLKGEF